MGLNMVYEDLHIVGIGASAGGFEALQKFLSKIKMNDKICYIIAQHLDAKRPTLLGELLSKNIEVEILAIRNDEEIKGNRIYYCPPNTNFVIKGGKFLFNAIEKDHKAKPSIDKFLKSLAYEKKEKAVGIILSGSGSDGAEGIVEIYKNNGITLAEDESAKYFSMPKAAIDTGKVLASLPPELLAEGILNVIEDRKYYEKQFEIEDSIDQVFDILRDETSIDFSAYKYATVTRRIKKRMLDIKSDGINDYIKTLLIDSEEIHKLKDELLIIVTSFFRDEEAFIELKNHLEALIEKKLDNNIRIWVTACATGEEAFSVAMIVSDILEKLRLSKKVTIFATDISEKVIAKCRNRTFLEDDLEAVPKHYLEKYFEENQKVYKVTQNIRDMIVFSSHDIIKDPPFLNMDMITCRNLLIYFNNELQKRILSIFYYSMRYESLLFLGKSETVGTLNTFFTIVNNKYRIYKKLNDLAKVDLETLTYRRKNTASSSVKSNKETLDLNDIDISINQAISSRFEENGIVVDGITYNILFFKGDCKDFLNHPQGIQTSDVFRILADFLRLDFRATINEAKKLNKFVKSKKIRILPVSEPKEYVVINVYPLEKNKLGDNNYFVSFDKSVDMQSSVSEDKFEPFDLNDSSLSVLEDELLTLKERLQITIEELETSNEDLQSTNEELQSTNEELQSTNEELETSNEELQSTNEELQTVNDELNLTNLELDFANNAFDNVLANIGASVILLDSNLNIIKYTENIVDFFDLSKYTNNNFSSILLNSNIELQNILEDIKKCLSSDEETNYEIEYKNKYYDFSIKKIDLEIINKERENKAIIISFVDKTENVKQDRIIFEQAKLVSMGEMITNISHQWRQPLSMISTIASGVNLQIEMEDSLDIKNIEKDMNSILDQVKYLSQTIENFRNFVRTKEDFRKIDLEKAIKKTISLVEASLKNNFITLEIHNFSKDLTISACSNELVEAFINIINNCKDALVENVKDEADRILFIDINKNTPDTIDLKFTDTAGGAKEEIIKRMLEPYFTTKDNGTGLGLSIVNKIIRERHHAKINLSNEEITYNNKNYKGLSFCITFKC